MFVERLNSKQNRICSARIVFLPGILTWLGFSSLHRKKDGWNCQERTDLEPRNTWDAPVLIGDDTNIHRLSQMTGIVHLQYCHVTFCLRNDKKDNSLLRSITIRVYDVCIQVTAQQRFSPYRHLTYHVCVHPAFSWTGWYLSSWSTPPNSTNTLTDYDGVGYADDKSITRCWRKRQLTVKLLRCFRPHYHTTHAAAMTGNTCFAKVGEIGRSRKRNLM